MDAWLVKNKTIKKDSNQGKYSIFFFPTFSKPPGLPRKKLNLWTRAGGAGWDFQGDGSRVGWLTWSLPGHRRWPSDLWMEVGGRAWQAWKMIYNFCTAVHFKSNRTVFWINWWSMPLNRQNWKRLMKTYYDERWYKYMDAGNMQCIDQHQLFF